MGPQGKTLFLQIDITHVRATPCLLSYTKIQCIITAGLSFTIVKVSNNGIKYIVWLSDGNVCYLEGKQIPLFLDHQHFVSPCFVHPLRIHTFCHIWALAVVKDSVQSVLLHGCSS